MSERVKVLLVIVITVVAVVVYAVVPQETGRGEVKLRKLDVASLSDAIPWTDHHDSIPAEATPKAEFANRVDTTRHTILFFGDSMTNGLVGWLDDYCRANGYRLYSVVWYSATTERFAKSNIVDTYIHRYHPDFFIVCLGSNELFVRDLADRERFIRAIVRKFAGKQFVWISPPNWKHDTGIDSLIRRTVGNGRYFDSSRLALARSRDRMHPTNSASRVWMDSIAAWMSNPKLTAHAIRMDRPKEWKGAPSYDVYLPEFTNFEGGDKPERHRHFKRDNG